jgi:signal transduction histidine kinase
MLQREVIFFIIIANIILLIFIVGIIIFIYQYRKRKIESETEKKQIHEMHKEELLSTQLEMQTQTMQHIGREIHDSVGQKLTLASLYTQQLAYENKAPQVTDKIENISQIINESLQELRQLSKNLTDDVIAENDLTTLLKNETTKINNLKRVLVTFANNAKPNNLSYQTKNILLRVVQEFIQNSLKHAACKNIFITLSQTDNMLQLNLEDDGKGFDTKPENHTGIGLQNIKKRIGLIGGNYTLESSLNKGTSLQIQIAL